MICLLSGETTRRAIAVKKISHSTILFAERNPNVRELIQRELLNEGYAVLTVKDGKELCAVLEKENHPDLVLLDPDLPYLGMEDVQHCLLRRTVTLPLVVYGFAGESLPHILGSRTFTHVTKDADPQDLKTTVRSVLKTRALGQG